jgi:hypothetical protein
MHSSGSRQRPVEGSCERDNKHSGTVKGGKFLAERLLASQGNVAPEGSQNQHAGLFIKEL